MSRAAWPRLFFAAWASGGLGCAGLGARSDPGSWGSEAGVARPASWAQLLAVEPGCAPAASPGLDAEALGVAGLSGGSGRVPPPAPGDVEALAALVDRFVAGAPPVELNRPALMPVDAEVAGRAVCTGLDVGRLVVDPSARSIHYIAPSPGEQADLAAGSAALAAGKAPEARIAFASAARQGGGQVAGPGLAIARSYAAEDRWSEAAAAFADLGPRFARITTVQAGFGHALLRSGRRGEAADAWARAIALAPGATGLIRQVGADPFVELHPPVPPPAARAADGRWVMRPLRASPGHPGGGGISPEAAAAAVVEAQAYATCKDAFRRLAPLQEAVAGQILSPWRWSPGEEAACTAVWLRAYQRNRDVGRPEDEGLDDLVAIAKQGYLVERALFDVGALAHPLVPLLLDDAHLARLFAFVAAHRVLHRHQGGWLL